VLAALVVAVAGCQKEGPMERAGKEVDKAVKKVTQRIEWAGPQRLDAAAGNVP
jgi:predicted small lipoprotein YifL